MTHANRSRRAGALTTAAAISLMLLGACRTTQRTHFMHENADLGAIQKVAVLPFENVSAERSAADKVQKIFQLELLALDVFEVVEPGSSARVVRQQDVANLTPADFQRIGKELGVDALFTGSVVDFAEARTGQTPTPDVTIQLRLIETGTGSTIWSTGETRSGANMSTRLLGVGGESLSQAARKIIRNELRTLLK